MTETKSVLHIAKQDSPAAWAGFAPDELHWAVHGWARLAPGLGGWRIALIQGAHGHGEVVAVAPPSPLPDPMDGPKYRIGVADGEAVLFADVPGQEMSRIAAYPSLADALHALCPLTPGQETQADALAAKSREMPKI